MKEIYFSEDQLNNLNKIGQTLFCEDNDPTSPSYNRVLIRPKINYLKIILHIGLPLVALLVYILVLRRMNLFNGFYVFIALIGLIVYAALCFKKGVLCCIRIYQRFAPDKVRKKCRFEPSCSQYMILAIEKYGMIKGLSMGIKRLQRCNIHHGGYDFP